MKLDRYVLSALLALSFASSPALAYSGSECEVQDCSGPKPAKANGNAAKGQKAKGKNESNAQAAQGEAKNSLADKVPQKLKGLTDLLK